MSRFHTKVEVHKNMVGLKNYTTRRLRIDIWKKDPIKTKMEKAVDLGKQQNQSQSSRDGSDEGSTPSRPRK